MARLTQKEKQSATMQHQLPIYYLLYAMFYFALLVLHGRSFKLNYHKMLTFILYQMLTL